MSDEATKRRSDEATKTLSIEQVLSLDDDPRYLAGCKVGRRNGREECFALVCAAAQEAEGIKLDARMRKEAAVFEKVRLHLHEVAGAIKGGMVLACPFPNPPAAHGSRLHPAKFGAVTAALGKVYAFV